MSKEIAIFGTGCFWCSEALFSRLMGVISVTPGYAGGYVPHPTYEQICSGNTGHAEVIRIEFNPSKIDYTTLLDIFFHVHNPTTNNRQDNDVGTQYRSIILYTNKTQEKEAKRIMEKLNKDEFLGHIVTEVKPLIKFYEAESYHKDYYTKNAYQPYCQVIISPKLASLKKKYSDIYQDDEHSQ